jgi:hypothetical protein
MLEEMCGNIHHRHDLGRGPDIVAGIWQRSRKWFSQALGALESPQCKTCLNIMRR